MYREAFEILRERGEEREREKFDKASDFYSEVDAEHQRSRESEILMASHIDGISIVL